MARSEAAAARRALAWVSRRCFVEEIFPHHRRAQGGAAHHPARRAERSRGAGNRRPRLCAGERAHHPVGTGGAVANDPSVGAAYLGGADDHRAGTNQHIDAALLIGAGIVAACQVGKAFIAMPLIVAELHIGVDIGSVILAVVALTGALGQWRLACRCDGSARRVR